MDTHLDEGFVNFLGVKWRIRDIVTLVIGSTVLTVGGTIALVGGGAFLLFISPVLLFFSPILVPLAILAGLATAGFASFLAFLYTGLWTYKYFTGATPIGSGQADKLIGKTKDGVHYLQARGEDTKDFLTGKSQEGYNTVTHGRAA